MRQKDMAAREAKKTDGQQIKLMVPLPDKGEMTTAEIESSAYEVGWTYTMSVLRCTRRCAAPATPRISSMSGCSPAALKNYKALVIVGQTFPLPADEMAALAKFRQDRRHGDRG